MSSKQNKLSSAEIREVKKALSTVSGAFRDSQTMTREELPEPVAPATGRWPRMFGWSRPEPVLPSQLKQKALALVKKYRKDIDVPDLPRIQAEMKVFFRSQRKQPYYRLMDLRAEKEDRRLVIIGDTHCDYNSLAGIIEKLSVSSYDYFEKATFIFLGDYLDRGNILFEYVMLLIGLKKLLGERCILMKGNHELISFNPAYQELESKVEPSDSCPLLNKYCGTDKEFLALFADYFSSLPTYILLKTRKGTDLLVHGGIPRDIYMDRCHIVPETGELKVKGDDFVRGQILDNMIWADPRPEKSKLQGGGSRFEFGEEQFMRFAVLNKIDRIFRSHEPVNNGIKSFYGDRVITIFSNGGRDNSLTGYSYVDNPAFGIMNADGEIRYESVHLKKCSCKYGFSEFSTYLYMGKLAEPGLSAKVEDPHLNDEFQVVSIIN